MKNQREFGPGFHPNESHPRLGWECPRCGAVNCPTATRCTCGPNRPSISVTSDPIRITPGGGPTDPPPIKTTGDVRTVTVYYGTPRML